MGASAGWKLDETLGKATQAACAGWVATGLFAFKDPCGRKP